MEAFLKQKDIPLPHFNSVNPFLGLYQHFYQDALQELPIKSRTDLEVTISGVDQARKTAAMASTSQRDEDERAAQRGYSIESKYAMVLLAALDMEDRNKIDQNPNRVVAEYATFRRSEATLTKPKAPPKPRTRKTAEDPSEDLTAETEIHEKEPSPEATEMLERMSPDRMADTEWREEPTEAGADREEPTTGELESTGDADREETTTAREPKPEWGTEVRPRHPSTGLVVTTSSVKLPTPAREIFDAMPEKGAMAYYKTDDGVVWTGVIFTQGTTVDVEDPIVDRP